MAIKPKISELYGYASIFPRKDVKAGSYGTWMLTYSVGLKGLATGGAIRVTTECDTDWGIPQFKDPQSSEYATVEIPNDANVSLLVEDVKSIVIVIIGRSLQPGENVTLIFGDRSEGGPGSRAQTYLEEKRYFWVEIDAEGNGSFITLPNSPHVSIVGGDTVDFIVVAPSIVSIGQHFCLLVRAVDSWGNPSKSYSGTINIQAEDINMPKRSIAFTPEDIGVKHIHGFSASRVGIKRIIVRDKKNHIIAHSNPILCLQKPTEYSLIWGDPHGGQIALASKIRDFFRYARDIAGLDFVGYQRNDHYISNEDWKQQQKDELEFTQLEHFIPLPGYEWSPITQNGGHRNILFRYHGLPIRRNSHKGVTDKSDCDTDLPNIIELYNYYKGKEVLIIPHIGGEHSDLKIHEPTLEPVIEVTSTHGTFEWFLEESLRYGYKMGFIGGSDSHTGRPGTDNPGHQYRRYAKSGLTGLYTSEVTLDAIYDALKHRRCYATTGARIILKIDCDGRIMGEEYVTSSIPTISATVIGTAPLETVELFRGLEKIYSRSMGFKLDSNRIRILWEGASRKASYSGVIWEGYLKVTGRKLVSIEKIRFDSPRSHINDVNDNTIQWHSVTCGYRSGIILTLDGDEDTEFHLIVKTSLMTRPNFGEHGELPPTILSYAPAETMTVSFTLKDFEKKPVEFDIGVLNRKITVSMAPEKNGIETLEFNFKDNSPKEGINSYWVRIIQTDMEMAWSSPIFMNYNVN